MLYRIAADAVLLLHLAFILFALFGALLATRWHWIALVHLPAIAWGCFIELSGGICPLTPLENELRFNAGQAGFSGGFIEHYLLGLIYPAGLTWDIQILLAATLLSVNMLIYGWLIWRWYYSPGKRKRSRQSTSELG